MICGIIDFFSPTTNFRSLRAMGDVERADAPHASAYLCGGVGLFCRSRDPFLTYPITKTVDGKSYTLIIEGECRADDEYIISGFHREGENFLCSLCGRYSLSFFDASEGALYIFRTSGATDVYFSGDIRLVFATSEKALSAFPEKLYGVFRLRENTLLRYDIQGVRLIKK